MDDLVGVGIAEDAGDVRAALPAQAVDFFGGVRGDAAGEDVRRWWEWWQDYNQKWWPQVSQFVYDQQQHLYGYINPAPQTRHSCFVAGTLVRTESGLTAIESIQPGDRVLAQDQDTGELAYKLVAARTLRPPAAQ